MMLRDRISLTAQSGQTMAEYAVVLTVIILAVIASLTLFSEAVAAGLSDVGNVLKGLA